MPVYPGSDSPEFTAVSSICLNGYAEKRMTLFSHTGTHMDAPSHILQGGMSLDQMPIEQFTGKAVVLNVSSPPLPTLTLDDVMKHHDLVADCDFVLLHTGWNRHWGSDSYFTGYPVLSVEAANWLSGFKLKGLGIDAISVDHPDSSDFPVHRQLLRNRIVIIENLNCLEYLPQSGFIFIGLPLPIVKGDGSPVRAAAWLEDEMPLQIFGTSKLEMDIQ